MHFLVQMFDPSLVAPIRGVFINNQALHEVSIPPCYFGARHVAVSGTLDASVEVEASVLLLLSC